MGFASKAGKGLALVYGNVFPERQIMVRTAGRLRVMRLRSRVQLAASTAVLGLIVWATFASTGFYTQQRVVETKDHQIAQVRQAYNDLADDVESYRLKFHSLTGELENRDGVTRQVMADNDALNESLRAAAAKLETIENNRQLALRSRESLAGQLQTLENEMRGLAARNKNLSENFESRENQLAALAHERDDTLAQMATARETERDQLTRERDAALSAMTKERQQRLALQARNFETEIADLTRERDGFLAERQQLAGRVDHLESTLSEYRESEVSLVRRMADLTNLRVSELEIVLEPTGLDLAALVDTTKKETSQGGPFIALDSEKFTAGDQLKEELDNLYAKTDRWEGLKQLLHAMPLQSPVDSFYISSGFGKRRDPVNKRWSMHYGLDMGAPKNTSIYAPAAGKVKFAGSRGGYGKVIEIDHGYGVITRFAHLGKIKTKKGAVLELRDRIALVGMSGRSTGPHLHYEVIVNGKHINPHRFIKAGKNVFKG